jgi:hypothetical protein
MDKLPSRQHEDIQILNSTAAVTESWIAFPSREMQDFCDDKLSKMS